VCKFPEEDLNKTLINSFYFFYSNILKHKSDVLSASEGPVNAFKYPNSIKPLIVEELLSLS